MAHQEQNAFEGSAGMALAERRATAKAAAGRAFEDLGRYSLMIQNAGNVFSRDYFVSRRIRRVDADQPLQPVHSIALDAWQIRASRRRGRANGLRTRVLCASEYRAA